MVGAAASVRGRSPPSVAGNPSSSIAIADWLVDRLPAVAA